MARNERGLRSQRSRSSCGRHNVSPGMNISRPRSRPARVAVRRPFRAIEFYKARRSARFNSSRAFVERHFVWAIWRHRRAPRTRERAPVAPPRVIRERVNRSLSSRCICATSEIPSRRTHGTCSRTTLRIYTRSVEEMAPGGSRKPGTRYVTWNLRAVGRAENRMSFGKRFTIYFTYTRGKLLHRVDAHSNATSLCKRFLSANPSYVFSYLHHRTRGGWGNSWKI